MKISKVSRSLVCCQLLISAAHTLTFEAQSSSDEQWVFQEGLNATLVCTNKPYTGIHTFTFDSAPMLSCIGNICITKDNEQGEQGGFSFKYDTDSGIFTWIINAMKKIYHGKVFGCKDGSDHANITATLEGKSLTLITQNSQDGQWTVGSTVTLVCSNYPYTGIHKFTLDYTPVYSCIGSVCVTKDNDQGGFSFKNNTISGIFTWIINTVKIKYNGMIFGCQDGSNHTEFRAVTVVKGDSSDRYLVVLAVVVAAVIIIPISVSIILVVKFRHKLTFWKLCNCQGRLCKLCDRRKKSPARPVEEQRMVI